MPGGFSALYGPNWCALRRECLLFLFFVFCIGCWLRTELSMHIYGQLQILQHINLHLHMACGRSRHSIASTVAYRFAVCERSDGHHVSLSCTFTPVTILRNELRSRCNRMHGKRQIPTSRRQRWANDAPWTFYMTATNERKNRTRFGWKCTLFAAFDRLLSFRLK